MTVLSIASLVWEIFKFVWNLVQKSPGQKIAERVDRARGAVKKAREDRDVDDLERVLNGK